MRQVDPGNADARFLNRSPAAHRAGWRRRQVMALTSSKSWMAESACEASMAPVPSRRRRWVSTSLPGAPAFWAAGLHPAAQRRTIGVVARRWIGGLRPRRWHAGGLLRGVNSRTGTLYREGCPAAPLCGSCRVAGRSVRHNGVPGTPRLGVIGPRSSEERRRLNDLVGDGL